MNPREHSGARVASAINPITMSSLTRPPDSIAFLACKGACAPGQHGRSAGLGGARCACCAVLRTVRTAWPQHSQSAGRLLESHLPCPALPKAHQQACQAAPPSGGGATNPSCACPASPQPQAKSVTALPKRDAGMPTHACPASPGSLPKCDAGLPTSTGLAPAKPGRGRRCKPLLAASSLQWPPGYEAAHAPQAPAASWPPQRRAACRPWPGGTDSART
jgi:hypothetical protein